MSLCVQSSSAIFRTPGPVTIFRNFFFFFKPNSPPPPFASALFFLPFFSSTSQPFPFFQSWDLFFHPLRSALILFLGFGSSGSCIFSVALCLWWPHSFHPRPLYPFSQFSPQDACVWRFSKLAGSPPAFFVPHLFRISPFCIFSPCLFTPGLEGLSLLRSPLGHDIFSTWLPFCPFDFCVGLMTFFSGSLFATSQGYEFGLFPWLAP